MALALEVYLVYTSDTMMSNSNLYFDASLKDVRNRSRTCKECWNRNNERKVTGIAFEPPNSGDCPKTGGDDISRYRRGSRNKLVNIGLSCDAL